MSSSALLALFLLLSSSARAALPGDAAALLDGVRDIEFSPKAVLSEPPREGSLGAPPSLGVQLLLRERLSGLETPAAAPEADTDVEDWPDDRLLGAYESELDATLYWLEQAASTPEALGHLGEYQVAARGGRSRSRMSGVSCMAAAIQGEAGGESAAGKAMVAQTIMSRAGGNPARVCAVVFAYGQFEAMTKRPRRPSAETLRIAQAAIRRGGGCGFDHFINKALQRSLGRRIPSWVIRFERRGCRHKKVGSQDYYSSCSCRR